MKFYCFKNVLILVLLLPSIQFIGQSEIGFITGYFNKNYRLDENGIAPIIRFRPEFSNGVNFGFSYSYTFNQRFKLKNQLRYLSYRNDFNSFFGPGVFQANKTGSIHFSELYFSVIPQIKIVNDPVLFLGLGLTYLRQLDNSVISIEDFRQDFNAGQSITFFEERNQYQIINPDQFSFLVEIEYQHNISEHLSLGGAINYHYGFTRAIQRAFSNPLTTFRLLSFDIGLFYKF